MKTNARYIFHTYLLLMKTIGFVLQIKQFICVKQLTQKSKVGLFFVMSDNI